MRSRFVATVALVLIGCGDAGTSGVNPAPTGQPWQKLSQWGLFSDLAAQVPADGVHPYEVISPLFSDYTEKHRFFWVPDGTQVTVTDDGVWSFPVGAILVKTFAYAQTAGGDPASERLLETRLLVHEPNGWVPHSYIFAANASDATLKVAGAFIPATFVTADGETRETTYIVPTKNQCFECHGTDTRTGPLGPKTAQLDRPAHPRFVSADNPDNQLDRYLAVGVIDRRPTATTTFAAPDNTTANLELRARSYLDANCAHCHSPTGDASAKGLYLDFASTGPDQPASNWGVCKVPTSAGGSTRGHVYDVVPGSAATSIMTCRMASTEGKDQMPPLGRAIAHDEGLALITEWIDTMSPAGCDR